MNNSIIPIFFSVDDAYAPFLSVALDSAVKTADSKSHYKAIILYQELSKDNITKLSSLATDYFEIEFTPMQSQLDCISDRTENRLRFDCFTLTIYFRLFIPAMFPQYDKGIYVDSDIVLLGDIKELFDIDIGDNFIGACKDHSVSDIEPLGDYMEKAIGIDRYKYINSGILLMNMKKLRESGIDRHFLNLLNEYHFDSVAPDQDYLNALCYDNIYFIDECWDAMPNDRKPPLENAKLIHYNLFSKPWCYDNVQYGDYFWEYAKDSKYYDQIVAFKNAYTASQKLSDEKCLQMMIEHANDISASDITFRKLFESGVKIRL